MKYLKITIQPANLDKAHEVWGAYTTSLAGMGTFDTDGIIGFLYEVGAHWVFLDEAGHPTMVFAEWHELAGWLQSLSPTVDWPESYKQPKTTRRS